MRFKEFKIKEKTLYRPSASNTPGYIDTVNKILQSVDRKFRLGAQGEKGEFVADVGQKINSLNDTLTGNINGKKANKPVAVSSIYKDPNVFMQNKSAAAKKEHIKIKPTDIFTPNMNVKIDKLFDTIINNATLKDSDAGKIVISMAEQIQKNQKPTLPANTDDAIKSAIGTYAGEYLGICALAKNLTNFANKKDFDNWIGNMNAVEVNFPTRSNEPLIDATLTNTQTQHQMMIGAKYEKGAAPSLAKFKIPDSVLKNSKYKTAVEFLKIVQDKNIDSFELPFKLSNYIKIDVKNWSDADISNFRKSHDDKTPLPQYQSIWQSYAFRKESTDAAKLWYAVKNQVMKSVNNDDKIPEFNAAVLEILGYNYIQQHASFKGNILEFETLWPNKINGKVQLETKGGATDPFKGGKLNIRVL
jgi:hypothetical protein